MRPSGGPMAPRRYLVFANQTLAEAELGDAIRQRLEAGPSSFYMLVPNTDWAPTPTATSGRRTRSRRWTTCWPPGSSTRSSSRPCPNTSRSGSGWTSRPGAHLRAPEASNRRKDAEMARIELQDVSKVYAGGVRAVNALTSDIPDGTSWSRRPLRVWQEHRVADGGRPGGHHR